MLWQLSSLPPLTFDFPTNYCRLLLEVLMVLAEVLSLARFGGLEGCEQFIFPHGLGYLGVEHRLSSSF